MKARLLFRRLEALFRTRRYDRELDDEVLAHLELAEREALAAGMSPEDARREARLRFGGIGVMKEEHRDRRSVRWLETLSRDVRYAFRSLMRDRTFTAVAIAVLTLAIGAGTTVFSVVDAVVLRGLPFEEDDRLVAVKECSEAPQARDLCLTTTQTFLDWRREQRSFESIAAVGSLRPTMRLPSASLDWVVARRVSHEFFTVLRVSPMLGRPFAPDEEIDGQHRVAILGHGFWLRAFAGDPDVVGRTVEIGDEPFEIVGVMPRGFSYPVASYSATEIYVPIRVLPTDRIRGRGRSYNFTIIGRLSDGVSVEQADADLAGVTSRLASDFLDWFKGRTVSVTTLHNDLTGGVRSWMYLLLGSVVVVLLIACANVANLMLARSTVRTREVAVRAALGASRLRLVRGLMTEGLMLATAGAALGVGVAYLGTSTVAAWLPVDLPRVTSVAVDLRVLAATSLAAVVTAVVFSSGPAWQTSKPDLSRALRDGGRSVVSLAGHRMRAGLVVAEVAFAAVLVIGMGLFAASLVKWTGIDLGFDHRNLIALQMALPSNQREVEEVTKQGGAAVQAYFDGVRQRHAQSMRDIVEAIQRVPGVADVAAASAGVPLTGSRALGGIAIPERGVEAREVNWLRATATYAGVLGVTLREGRYLTDADEPGAGGPVVVNESAVRAWWAGDSPVGQRFIVNGQERTVVGVISDVRHLGPEMPMQPEVHLPMASSSWSGAWLVVRATRGPNDVLPGVQAAIRSVNPDQLMHRDVFTLQGYADRMVAERRFTMTMIALLGIVGLVIAAAGVYGVMAYTVSQRRQEIGVRMALGARPADVVSMILGRSAVLIVAGLVIGTTCAWYLSSTVESFLFQLSPTDPYIYAAAIATLGVTGLVASIIPARRAAKVDPLIALRAE